MAADDDSAVWDLDCDDDDSSSRRPTIMADRVRSAGSSAGRTSSGSRYSIDGFDFAFTRGVDYAEISEELAHMAVWSSIESHPEAQGTVEEQEAPPSSDAWDVEPDEPAGDVVDAPEPKAVEQLQPRASAGPASEADASCMIPVIILTKVPGDFRSCPLSSWSALHAPFKPAGAPQAKLRIAPADEIRYTISGPLGDTSLLLDRIAAETKGMETVADDEEGELEGRRGLIGVAGGDFRDSPKATWASLHAPFSPSSKLEAPAQTLAEALEASAEAPDKEVKRPGTVDLLVENSRGISVETPAEAMREAPLAGESQDVGACAEETEEFAPPPLPTKPVLEDPETVSVKALPEDSAQASAEASLSAPAEPYLPPNVLDENPVDEPAPAHMPVQESAEVSVDVSVDVPVEQEMSMRAQVEPSDEISMPTLEPPKENEGAPTDAPSEALHTETSLSEARLDMQFGTPIGDAITSDAVESAPGLASKEAAVELVAETQEDAQPRSVVIEPPAEVTVSTEAVDRSAEPLGIKVEESMLTMDSTEMPSLEPADLQTETSVEVSTEAPLHFPSEQHQDAKDMEQAPDVSTEFKLAGSSESEKDDQPGRVAPAESLDETFGLGKTEQVLDSVMPGVQTADNSTDELSLLSMKYAGPHEMTADPAQAATETELKPKEDPISICKNTLGREHEAWVASVFSKMAAETPIDRPVRKPGMQRLSTISIARALGCYPAVQQSSPSVARDSHMAHAGTNSFRSPLSSAPISSQPRSLWTPPSPPAPSSIRSQGSNELSKVPPLGSMPATGFRLSPTNSANSELASAARRCRSAVPGLDMTKVHMGYDDDEDTEDDHTSSLFKTQKGLTVEAGEFTPTSGAKAEVPQLNMGLLQKKASSGHSNKLTHGSGGPRSSLTSPPAPRGIPPNNHGQANMQEELSEQPPRPQAPTPRTAGQIDGLRSSELGDNMVREHPLDYWRGNKAQRRATVGAVEQGPFPSLNLQKRHTTSAGAIGTRTSNLEMMSGFHDRRAVSASELQRPVPLDQPILKGYSHKAFLSSSPAPHPGSAPAALPGSRSVPLLPDAVGDPASNAYSTTQGNLWGHDQWTLDAIGCVVAEKKLPLNAPAVVRLPPVGKKQQWQKWQVGNHPGDLNGLKRSKATIISHTHVHHHHHYHVRRPTAAADTGPGVPGASAEGMQAS